MKNYFLVLSLVLTFFASGVYAKKEDGDVSGFSEPFLAQKQTGNNLTVLNSGIASFQKRLDLIKQAKHTIEVEYFIYSLDTAGRLFTQELVRAANRGVKVRILVDKSAPIFELNRYYADALKKLNIEVRYYNKASLLRLSTSQFRSHRKLFVIDDRIAITGGRNLADEYYDLSEEFNFLDRDVLVEGPTVKIMRESFEKFWNHKIVAKPKTPYKPRDPGHNGVYIDSVEESEQEEYEDNLESYNEKVKLAQEFVTPTEDDSEYLQRLENISRPIIKGLKAHSCPELTFASDLPGSTFFTRIKSGFTNKYRVLRKVIFNNLMATKEKALLSSPYFIHNIKARQLFNKLLKKNIKMTTYTNSLASTDAVYVAANYYRSVHRWQREGMIPYIHAGSWMDEGVGVISEKVKSAKWGTHSKTHVYDDDTIMIGTYNVDQRSNFYNTEMAIFCRGNLELAAEVKQSIESRMNEGYQIVGKRKAIDKNGEEVDIYGGASGGSRLMMRTLALPSWFFSYLL